MAFLSLHEGAVKSTQMPFSGGLKNRFAYFLELPKKQAEKIL